MTLFASLIDLPQEIIDLITPLIDPKDYASCVGVSHAWHTLFIPLLWKVIRVVDETFHERFNTREARFALARNIQYIRTVETTDPAFVFCLGNFAAPVTNLQSLTIRLKDHRSSTITEFAITDKIVLSSAWLTGDDTKEKMEIPRSARDVIRILGDSPDLRHLSLDIGCFRYHNESEGFADLVAAIPTAKLEKLELSFLQSIPYNKEINTANDENLDVEKIKQYAFMRHEPFAALKEVVITGGSQNYMDPNRLFFLLRCPNIETIRLHRLDDKAIRSLPLFINSACHKLSCLEWRKSVYDDEDLIADLIRLTKLGWRELRLPHLALFGTFAFSALMESVGTLEVLRIESAEELELNAFVDVLCSARKLRRLEGIADGQRHRNTSEFWLYAQEVYLDHVEGGSDRSWVLGPSMEHLQLRIEGVPRPDVLYYQNGHDLGVQEAELDPALRFDVQRWIYTQLGRMTGLQELILGLQNLSANTMRFAEVVSSMDAVVQEEEALRNGVRMFNYQSLELSLESGLDLLAGMKEMRMLDVRSTAHNIGVAELEWMYRNWPKLKSIRGLESNRRWSVHHAEGPAVKAAVDDWMASHPLGIGSSFY
jgi:hypothetical protein